MKRDQAMEWIREVRGVISGELRNDPRQFVEFHKKLRSKYKRMSEPVHRPDRHSAPLDAGR